MTTYLTFTRQLPKDLMQAVNKSGSWNSQIWGPAYADMSFIKRDILDDLPRSLAANLFTLEQFGIYRRAYRMEVNQPDLPHKEQLEIIFEAGNISPDHPKLERYFKADGVCSISVGDLTFLEDYSQGWVCCCSGWGELPKSICDYWASCFQKHDKFFGRGSGMLEDFSGTAGDYIELLKSEVNA